MASEHWFRWHHGCVTDPKWRVVASRCVTSVTVGHVIAVWSAMMENASQASPRGQLQGWDDEDVAVLLGFDIEQVSAIRTAMQGKVLDGDALCAWEKRQPKREDSAASRTKAWRERNKPKGDESTDAVTHGDASERAVTLETETETEKKEQKKTRALPAADLLPGISEQVAKDFIAIRKAKKAPLTETAVAGIQREADKAGLTLQSAIELCCARGWSGFKADWVTGQAGHTGGNVVALENRPGGGRRAL